MLSFYKVVPDVSPYYNNFDCYALLGGLGFFFVVLWGFFWKGVLGFFVVVLFFGSSPSPLLLLKLSSGQQDPPSKLPFLSYSKSTDLATKILPATIMIPQQTSMVCLEQYSRQGEKTHEPKNFFPFKSIELALANRLVSRLQFA